jgi:type I restriction enzyme S subunit
MFQSMAGSALKRITISKINEYYIVLPSLDEQLEILSFLDKKCAEISIIIDKKQEQLNILEQYKKSLIYEYVTGKKEVPSNY